MLQKKIKEVSDQKQKLESIPEPKVTIEEAKEAVITFDDILEHGSLDDVRTVISTLIEKIELDGEDVYIYWNFE